MHWISVVAILDIRQRAGYLFLAVVLGQIILISAQVNSRTGVPVLESVTFGLFAEVQRTASALVQASCEHDARVARGDPMLQRQLVALLEHPGTQVSASASLGIQPLLLEVVLERAEAAASALALGSAALTALLLVGRGSSSRG